jgi:hypothetical protein
MHVLDGRGQSMVAGGISFPGEEYILPAPGISEVEWQQWLDFFEDQVRRNASHP